MVALPVEAPDTVKLPTPVLLGLEKVNAPTPVAFVVTVTASIPDAATAVPVIVTPPTPFPPTPVSEELAFTEAPVVGFLAVISYVFALSTLLI